jgi:hypothetical protein
MYKRKQNSILELELKSIYFLSSANNSNTLPFFVRLVTNVLFYVGLSYSFVTIRCISIIASHLSVNRKKFTKNKKNHLFNMYLVA